MIFWADWAEYTPIVNTIFDIYKTIDEVYEGSSAIWQPIADAIDKVVNTLTGGLANEIYETVSLLKGIIDSALTKLITEQIDILASSSRTCRRSAPCRRSSTGTGSTTRTTAGPAISARR